MSLGSPEPVGAGFLTHTEVGSPLQNYESLVKGQPTPVLLPGKFHGQRSLVGYSPWGRKESDTTERLHFPLMGIPDVFVSFSFFSFFLL